MLARAAHRFKLVVALLPLLALDCRAHLGPTEPTSRPASADPAPFALEELSLTELRGLMDSGKYTSRRLVELYLQRIAQIDRRGPTLRAVIETNPDALAIADALDRERGAKGPRGPLHGIPILLKDNIATADATETTAGSLALVGAKPRADASVARRLRRAGAVLLGKANMSEWANFRSSRSTSGWSARGGQTRNPYALDRNPCGSSSGSAVAVAASLAAAAIGTETDGSIVCPASANGVVGIKPTVGLISRAGIIPVSLSQDTAGPLARSVRDAALVLGALVGVDDADGRTAASAGKSHSDYTQFLDADGLKGARVGVSRKHFGRNRAVDRALERAIKLMRARGATIVDPVQVPAYRDLGAAEQQVLLYEFKAGINSYLAGLSGHGPRSLADLIAFNNKHAAQELRYFGQDLFERAQAKGGLTDPAYREARAQARRMAAEGIDKVMKAQRLDAIIGPSGSPAWTTDPVNGDHFTVSSSSAAAVAGYPNITVPVALVHGLPIGISFFGRAWSEPTLLRIAYAFEQAAAARQPPSYAPTLVDQGGPAR